VRCVTSPRLEAAFPASWQAEVAVRLRDGRVVEKSETAFQGSPGDRATPAQVQEKAAGLLGTAEAARLAEHIWGSVADAPWRGWQRSCE
jgi:hypothetical protein